MTRRELAKYGMTAGVYDGAYKRRFVLFTPDGSLTWRNEFDTKKERDAFAKSAIAKIRDRGE